MKPSYVSVEYKRETDAEIMTIEGWLTHPAMDEPVFYITPSLDFDDEVVKIGLLWSRIVSITPAQSVRAYAMPLVCDGVMGIDGRIKWNR